MMIDWNQIDSVFLDLDGTLLDLHFDNHFWHEHLPRRYGETCGLSLEMARADLLPRYAAIDGTLNWYCVDHWSQELGLDIIQLKQEIGHLIAVHPHVVDFLDYLARLGKRRVLVTNAHRKTLGLKMMRTQLAGHFERIVSAHDLGEAKESPTFWSRFQTIESFDLERTLFIDDNPSVLRAARAFGLRWLVAVETPDSCQSRQSHSGFTGIGDFAELIGADV